MQCKEVSKTGERCVLEEGHETYHKANKEGRAGWGEVEIDDDKTPVTRAPAIFSMPPLNPDEQAMLDHAFTYHPPTGDDPMKYKVIRESAKLFAENVLRCCPSSADRTFALRQIQDAVMTANRSIALGGKGMR